MTVTTTYSYIGDGTVVEFVTTYSNGDTTLTVNVLPNLLPPGPVVPLPAPLPLPDPAPVVAVEPQEAILAAPMPEPVQCAAAAPPTRKRRSLLGVIRATWFVIFTAVGEALTYALNNLTSFNLPPGTATALGAVGYGLKKAVFPDTTL